ncbi:hypothetical protein Tco_0405977, partial [Tanacetum coccineum]
FRRDGLKVADGYANNEGKEILEEHWKEVFMNGAPRNQENKNRGITRRVVPVEITTFNALVSCDGSGYDWSDQAEEGQLTLQSWLTLLQILTLRYLLIQTIHHLVWKMLKFLKNKMNSC